MAEKNTRKNPASAKRAGSGSGARSAPSRKKKPAAAKSTAAKASPGKKKAVREKIPEPAQERTDPMLYYEIVLWLILAFAVLLFISYLGFGGLLGEAVSSFGFGCFGFLAYLLPFLLIFLTAFLISNRKSHIAKIKAASVGGLYLVLCGVLELLMLGYTDGFSLMEYYEAGARYKTGGGLVGGFLANLLCPAIGMAGAYVVLILMALICVILITQRSLFAGMKQHGSRVYRTAREGQARRRELAVQRRSQLGQAREPEIFTLGGEGRANRVAEDGAGRLPVTFSVLPQEPRLANRVSGVTSDTDLSGSSQAHGRGNRESLPEQTEQLPAAQEITILRDGGPRRRTGAAKEEVSYQTLEKPAASLGAVAREDKDQGALDDTVIRAAHAAADGPSVQRASVPDAALAKEEDTQDLVIQGVHSTADDSDPSERRAGAQDTAYAKEEDEEDLESSQAAAGAIDRAPGRAASSQDAPGGSRSGQDADGQEGSSPRRQTRRARSSQEEIKEGIEDVEQEIEKTAAETRPMYRFPPLSLLKKPSGKQGGSSDAELRETAQKLQQILHTFGVNAKVTNVSCGPSVTRYELMPEMGVKVSKIVNLADDIKLNLAAMDIRIEAPIPGKAAVGIEVPNRESSGVLLRELLESEEFRNHPSNLCYAVGKDIAGKIIVSDIARMPHLLIAGATGSGKSVFINTLIMSIIYKAKPEDVKLIMIDPKVVELSVYNGIPHLFIPVVTDPKKAAGALNWGVAEMDQRYRKFAEYGVRDLKGYNAKIETIKDIEDENKPEKLPQIVIIVDELADLMMVASGEVEEAICRLAQLARAAGIHLVIATQRPSVDVITGLIKANMPSRIAFAVSSGVDSRTILDMNGAEKLLGNGDMLFSPQTYKKPARIQGAFVSDREVSEVVEFLKDQCSFEGYDAKMEEQIAQVQKSAAGVGGGNDVDELFADAGRFIIEKDKASIGMLQRWFKIGFNRAARIMDQLSDAGVVGPEEGTKPRKVLMSPEQFENYLEEN